MAIQLTGNADINFLAEILSLHQDTIDMTKVVL